MGLNNKGWGFVTFLFFIGLFLLALLMIIFTVNDMGDDYSSYGKNKSSNYDIFKDYEKSIVNAANLYIKENGFFEYIALDSLDVSDSIKSRCEGYASYDSSLSEYVGYINCDEYVSDGYLDMYNKKA